MIGANLALESVPVWLHDSVFSHNALWPWFAQRPPDRCVNNQETCGGSPEWTWSSHTPGAVTECSPGSWRTWERRTLLLLESFTSPGELRKLEPWRPWKAPGVKILSASRQLSLSQSILLSSQSPQTMAPCVRRTGQGTHYLGTGLHQPQEEGMPFF